MQLEPTSHDSHTETPSRRDLISADLLNPAVDKLLGSAGHKVIEWSEEIYKGGWDADSGIAVRLFGTAVAAPRGSSSTGSAPVTWSLVLKVPDQRPPSVDYREREAIFYGSPLIDEFPPLFSMPRLLNDFAHGDEHWVLMEEIDGLHGKEWPVDELVRTAGLLGELQGRLSNPKIEESITGLSDDANWYRTRYHPTESSMKDRLAAIREDSEGEQFLSSNYGTALLHTLDRHHELMDIITQMPRSICHGDFNFMNLRLRPTPLHDGAAEIVAIDWEYVGFRPIGADISGLVADSSAFGVRREVQPAVEFLDRCLDAYEEGLARGGLAVPTWHGRLAVLAQLLGHWALVIPLAMIGTLRHAPGSEERESGIGRCSRQCELLFDRALPEADELLRQFQKSAH